MRQEFSGHLGIDVSQGVACKCRAVKLVVTCSVERKKFAGQLDAKGAVSLSEQAQGAGSLSVTQPDQHAVDTIERCARHQPDEQSIHLMSSENEKPAFAGCLR